MREKCRKSSYSGFLIGFTVAIFTFLFSCSSHQNPKKSNNLKLNFSFGSDGDILLAEPQRMVTDDKGSIFVSDMGANRVYEFNYKGEFQQYYGREGRGPGEYQHPTLLETDGKWLYVKDATMRLVLFDLKDDNTNVIINRDSFVEFTLDDAKIYAFAPDHFRKPSTSDEDLIRVYNSSDGQLVNSFGKYLSMEEELPGGMSWPYIEIEDSVLHVAFQYFPFYRAYNTEGELLFELDLSQIVSGLPNVIQKNKDVETRGSSTDISAVYRSMDTFGSQIFIARQAPKIVIDEYLFKVDSLIHKKTYSYESTSSKRTYVQDFFYHPPSNSFYILEVHVDGDGAYEYEIGVYEIIEE